jgi:hypothetical protein
MLFRFTLCGRPDLWPAALFLLAVAAWIPEGGWACGETSSTPRLVHATASQEALAEAVLRAIADENLKAMQELSLSKEEFRRFVWPELPVSNPKTNVSLDFVWNDVYFRSMARMQASFNRLKGRNLKLVRVEHRGKVVEYKSHHAYQDMEVTIREAGGEEMSYPLFGTLIEMDGLWKVYSYAPYD